MSGIHWDGLSEEEQGWFVEAGKAAAAASRDRVGADEESGVALLEENGVEVVTEVDKAAFAAAVQPAYEAYAQDMGVADLIERIRSSE
jgi:TRAP-type C4-dicarboxylate transport system substrate-binding protein